MTGGEGWEGGVGCRARRPVGARGPALAKDGSGFKNLLLQALFPHLKIISE